MTLEVTQTIGLRKHQRGARDAHGNTVESWANPIPIGVYSVAPASSTEPFEAGREAVITGLTILAPPNTDVSRLDVLVVNGEEWAVEGDIANWGQGAFGWNPGLSINLKRVGG